MVVIGRVIMLEFPHDDYTEVGTIVIKLEITERAIILYLFIEFFLKLTVTF